MKKKKFMALLGSAVIIAGCGKNPTSSDTVSNQKTLIQSAKQSLLIMGASTTKRIINETIKLDEKQTSLLNDVSDIKFNKDIYASSLEKIQEERNRFSHEENVQKFALKTATYTTDAIFDAANAYSLGAANIIISPLKGIRNDVFEASISARIEDNNIQMAKTISLLATQTGQQLSQQIINFNGGSEELIQLREALIKSAEEKMKPADADLFKSVLSDESLSTSMAYVLKFLKESKQSIADNNHKLDECLQGLGRTNSSLVELKSFFKNFSESNGAFVKEQASLLKKIIDSGDKASLAKLDFLTQMTFGNLPAETQLQYLNSYSTLIPFSQEDKNKLIKSLTFKVNAEKALSSIAAFNTIGTNLDLLGQDAVKTINVSSTLISSATAFLSNSPIGYLNGVASLSSLFNKSKGDPRMSMILKNQQIILENLSHLNENINQLRSQIAQGFKELNEEIYLSRELSVSAIHMQNLDDCKTLNRATAELKDYDALKKYFSDEGTKKLTNCLERLKDFYYSYKTNDRLDFTHFLSYKANSAYEKRNLVRNYSNIFENINLNTPESISSAFNVEQLIDPEYLSMYVQMLLLNHHWFDMAELKDNGYTLVDIQNLNSKIKQNKTSPRMLSNALAIVKSAIFQHKLWSGIAVADSAYKQYKEIKNSSGISCNDDATNILCIASENPWFFNNLLIQIIHKEISYDYYFASMKIAPKDPTNLNKKMLGALKFVWLGSNPDPLFEGEVIQNESLVKKYGEGIFIKLQTKDRLTFMALPQKDQLRRRLAFEMPKTQILYQLKKDLEDEMIDLRLHTILNEQEYNQMVKSI